MIRAMWDKGGNQVRPGGIDIGTQEGDRHQETGQDSIDRVPNQRFEGEWGRRDGGQNPGRAGQDIETSSLVKNRDEGTQDIGIDELVSAMVG